jgi:hypothetical protein
MPVLLAINFIAPFESVFLVVAPACVNVVISFFEELRALGDRNMQSVERQLRQLEDLNVSKSEFEVIDVDAAESFGKAAAEVLPLSNCCGGIPGLMEIVEEIRKHGLVLAEYYRELIW